MTTDATAIDPDNLKYAETAYGVVAYQIDGDQHATPLLLLQRLRGTMEDWDPYFIECLSKRHKVIRFDDLGVSRSGG